MRKQTPSEKNSIQRAILRMHFSDELKGARFLPSGLNFYVSSSRSTTSSTAVLQSSSEEKYPNRDMGAKCLLIDFHICASRERQRAALNLKWALRPLNSLVIAFKTLLLLYSTVDGKILATSTHSVPLVLLRPGLSL